MILHKPLFGIGPQSAVIVLTTFSGATPEGLAI